MFQILIFIVSLDIIKSECDSSKFYSTITNKCEFCLVDQQQSSSQECECKPGYYFNDPQQIGFQQNKCQQCQNDQAIRLFGTGCISCDSNVATFTNNTCQCTNSDESIIESNYQGQLLSEQQCINCDVNSIYQNGYCVRCPLSFIANDDQCICDANTSNQFLNYCIRKRQLIDLGTSIPIDVPNVYSELQKTFTAGSETINSAIIYKYTNLAFSGCYYDKDPQSCQFLANLCLLAFYDNSKQPCIYQKQISDQRPLNNQGYDRGQRLDLTWLFYQNSELQITKNINLKQQVYNQPSNPNTYLQYYLTKFDLNGTFLGIEQLYDQLQLCQRSNKEYTNFLQFGKNYKKECNLNYTQINNVDYFYELYIQDTDNNYYPVPVQINNIFVRRFMIVNTLSGKQQLDSVLPNDYISYASSIIFKTGLIPEVNERMYVPYVVIQYKSMQQNNKQSINLPFTLETQYEDNIDSTITELKNYATILIILAIIIWILRMYTYQQIHQADMSDQYYYETLYEAIIQGCEIASQTIFIYLWIFTGYIFMFYKFQQATTEIINQNQAVSAYFFEMVISMVILRAVASLRKIIDLCSTEIFFLDWERSFFDSQNQASKQSVWRSYMVANAFKDLYKDRYCSIALSYFIFGAFFAGLNLYQWAYLTPFISTDLDNDYSYNQSDPLLRHFMSTTFLVLMGWFQIVIRKLISIWYPTKISNFTDLCSMTNISVFILKRNSNQGYYIHGCTPGGKADQNLRQLNQALKQESLGNVSGRGLVDSDPVQTFEILIPQIFKKEYENLFAIPLNIQLHEQSYGQQTTQILANIFKNRDIGQVKQIEKQKGILSKYIKLYVEGVRNNPANILEKTNYMKLLKSSPIKIDQIKQMPIFFKDRDFTFDKIFYCGNNMYFYITVVNIYLLIDYNFRDCFMSLTVSYVINLFLNWFYNKFTSRNLALKTLIEDRFFV